MAELIKNTSLILTDEDCQDLKTATFYLLEYLNDLGLLKEDKEMLHRALNLKETLLETVGEYWMSSTADDHWSGDKYDEWDFI